MTNFSDRLRHSLQNHAPQIRAEWEARPAAVLIPIYRDEDGDWHVLYTRRTDELEEHRGQVSFPGGLIEDGDVDAQAAALRETFEEIGIQPDDVDILGTLDSLLTVTQFQIAPIVGRIPWPYPFCVNTREVANVFGVPINWLADPENLEIRFRQAVVPGRDIPVYYFRPYLGETIWGATARITLNLLDRVKGK